MAVGHSFLLQRVQPAMVGLIDGSLSTLAPIFGIAFYTHEPHAAFVAGLATAIGAAISMAYSEGLSDTGELTGRGTPLGRGTITGLGTFLGGILHTLPFLIPDYRTAVITAAIVVDVRAHRARGAEVAILRDELRHVARSRHACRRGDRDRRGCRRLRSLGLVLGARFGTRLCTRLCTALGVS